MKRERLLTFALAAALAFTLAVGAAGCVISAFDLPIQDGNRLTFVCGAAALSGAFLYLWKWGGAALTAVLAVLAAYLIKQGSAEASLFALANHVSHVYNGAYGWGVLAPEDLLVSADLPMALLGLLTALAAARAVCRGKGNLRALLACFIPLAACVVVTDTVPDIAYLLPLLAGMLLLIFTAGVRREDAFQSNRLLLLLALPVVLGLGLLFRLSPQDGYVNQSKEFQQSFLTLLEEVPQKAESALDRLSGSVQPQAENTVDLKSVGQRPKYTYAVMDVTADQGGILYLRGQDYDTYTGTGWMAGSFRAEEFGGGEPTGTVTVRTRTKKDFIYLPYYPTQSQSLTGGLLKNPNSQKEYTWQYGPMPEVPPEDSSVSAAVELTPLEVQAFGSTAERLRYLTLPGETDIRAQAILKTFLPEQASRAEQAEAIASYVRSCAQYDLNTHRMPPEQEDFALWFLTDSETGYCVHFATAAVVLLRAADIPARYVTGYMLMARAGETVTVIAANAHAWAEYYSPQQNAWIPLEATPGEALYIPDADATVETDAPTPVPDTSGEATVPEPVPGTQPGEVPPTDESREEPLSPEEPAKSGGSIRWLLWLLLPAVLFGQYPLRLRLRQKRRHSGSPNRQALFRWRETEQLSRLDKTPPPEGLHQLAQKAKFSQHTMTQEELAQFDAYREETLRRLQARGLLRQILYRLILAVY